MNEPSWRRRARIRNTQDIRPDACPICGQSMTRRSVSHQQRCTGRVTAELLAGRWAA